MSWSSLLQANGSVPSTLCSLCLSLERLFFRPPEQLREANVLSTDDERSFNHYNSFGDLIEAVTRGCQLCGLMYTSLHQAYASKYPEILTEVAEFNEEMFHQDLLYLEDFALVSGRESCRPGRFVVRMMHDWYVVEDESFQDPYVRGFAGMNVSREWRIMSEELKATAILMFDTQDTESESSLRVNGFGASKQAHCSAVTNRAFSEGYILGRTIPQRPNWDLAKSWVRHCKAAHNCSTSLAFEDTPSRLIFIDRIKPAVSVRLIKTDVQQFAEYVCLSYRWSRRMTCKTTQTNVGHFYTRIDESMLPPLFRDAIIATSVLGYQYIWIDALCIIQDEEADFEIECPKMGSIFARAALTLAAPDVEDCSQEFLQLRQMNNNTCIMTYRDAEGMIKGKVKIWIPLQESDLPLHKRSARNSILDDRGWIMQERMLSPRLLYFSRQQMYFECHEHHYFETLHLAPDMHEDFVQKVNKLEFATIGRKEMYDWWYKMLNEYSERKLTYQEDKLPALSGVATFFRQIIDDEYVAGIWRNDIARGLAWFNHLNHRKADPRLEQTLAPYTAPSWSWAKSGCGSVVAMQQAAINLKFQLLLEVLDVKVLLKGTDLFGRLSGGILQVKGIVRKGFLFYYDNPNEYKRVLLCSDISAPGVSSLAVDLDEAKLESTLPVYDENIKDLATTDRVEALSMLLSRGVEENKERKLVYALILQTTSIGPTSDDCLKVKRIGLAQEEVCTTCTEVSPTEAWFAGCSETIVEIS